MIIGVELPAACHAFMLVSHFFEILSRRRDARRRLLFMSMK
jgi:hypothetical protein